VVDLVLPDIQVYRFLRSPPQKTINKKEESTANPTTA
jgi:hypothetical protein